MATHSSIAKEQPRLHAIFGLLTAADDLHIRNIFRQTDMCLLELAHHFGRQQAGWSGTGLEFIWLPSGQIEISSFISAALEGKHGIDFLVSLTPTWGDDAFPSELAWDIEAQIQADCQHMIDHRGMHLVQKLPTRRERAPVDAACALRDMTAELLALGKSTPLKHWLQLAGDEQNIG